MNLSSLTEIRIREMQDHFTSKGKVYFQVVSRGLKKRREEAEYVLLPFLSQGLIINYRLVREHHRGGQPYLNFS